MEERDAFLLRERSNKVVSLLKVSTYFRIQKYDFCAISEECYNVFPAGSKYIQAKLGCVVIPVLLYLVMSSG